MRLIRSTAKSRFATGADRRGASTVEMAMVLPIFVMVMLGIVEFGRAMMVGQLVTNAAREATRIAILDGSTNSDVTSAVTSFMQGAANMAAADVTVAITISNASAGGQLSNAQARDLITVKVSVPFSKVSYLPPTYLSGVSLSGQSSMRHE